MRTMRSILVAGMVLAFGGAAGAQVPAVAPGAAPEALPQPMTECLQRANMNWYQHGVSNTNALDECYVVGTEETRTAIGLLGKLQDNGSGTPAPSPWIEDHCEVRPGGYVCLAHGISVWFANAGPERGEP